MTCHHPGGIAPDYVDFTIYGTDTNPGARAWAVAVEEEMMMNRMPPWKPDDRFQSFHNTKELTAEETPQDRLDTQGSERRGRNEPRSDTLRIVSHSEDCDPSSEVALDTL